MYPCIFTSNCTFLVRFGGISGEFGRAMVHIKERGWRSGESARLPPMCPGFDSQSQCHMLVEFVVGSRPCF